MQMTAKPFCKESGCSRVILGVVPELENPVVGPEQPVAIAERKTVLPSKLAHCQWEYIQPPHFSDHPQVLRVGRFLRRGSDSLCLFYAGRQGNTRELCIFAHSLFPLLQAFLKET